MKKIALTLLATSLCGCPANPKVIKVQNGNEYSLSCGNISMEINAAKQAKLDAHEEDHFRFSDIFPPTGVISIVNIWRADSHATDRLELLEKIYQARGCNTEASSVPAPINQGNMPVYPPQNAVTQQDGGYPEFDGAPVD